MMTEWQRKTQHRDTSIKRFYSLELAAEVAELFPGVKKEKVAENLGQDFLQLELKNRIAAMAEAVQKELTVPYLETVEHLQKNLPPALPTDKGSYNYYKAYNVVAKWIELFGLQFPEKSLQFMESLTQRHTCEHALRPYLENHYDLTYAKAIEWTRHENFHVRRLASEGLRPRLPWSPKCVKHIECPEKYLAVLENLLEDSSQYVLRSVANGLNEASRDNAELALTTAQRWWQEKPSPATQYIVAYGLRNLVKKNDKRAKAFVEMVSSHLPQAQDT